HRRLREKMAKVTAVQAGSGPDREYVSAAHAGELRASNLPQVGAEFAEQHVTRVKCELRAGHSSFGDGLPTCDLAAPFNVVESEVRRLGWHLRRVCTMPIDCRHFPQRHRGPRHRSIAFSSDNPCWIWLSSSSRSAMISS